MADIRAEHSADGAIHFVCTDWRHLDEMLTAGRRVYRELKNLVVWRKSNCGMGSFYRSQHELIFVWKHGRGKHINNIELGQHGRNRSNVWTYAGANVFGADRLDELAMHPTVKPVALVVDGHPGLLPPRRSRPRQLWRQRHHPYRLRKDQPASALDRARPDLLCFAYVRWVK